MTAVELLEALREGGHDPRIVDGGFRISRASELPPHLRDSIGPQVAALMDLLAPPDRPIDPIVGKWFLTLPKFERRAWWRAVARHRCDCSTWYEAKQRATEELCSGVADR